MTTTTYSPIALFVFKRLEHTKLVIDSLLKNLESQYTILYVFADAARNWDEEKLVADVISYIQNIKGFASVNLIIREKNYGLSKSIITGIDYVLLEHDRLIVLEDDIVVSPCFLQYMNDGLHRYDQDDRVISIAAYCPPLTMPVPELFFLKGADCWGWGTWRRGWKLFNPNGQALLDQIVGKKLVRIFDFDGAYDFSGMLKNQIAGKNDSWAIRWYASAFVKEKLTLYPGRSLVRNIGLDGSGTHCLPINKFDVSLGLSGNCLQAINICESLEARLAFQNFYQNIKNTYVKTLFNQSLHFLLRSFK